jgi:hypothetical protein
MLEYLSVGIRVLRVFRSWSCHHVIDVIHRVSCAPYTSAQSSSRSSSIGSCFVDHRPLFEKLPFKDVSDFDMSTETVHTVTLSGLSLCERALVDDLYELVSVLELRERLHAGLLVTLDDFDLSICY